MVTSTVDYLEVRICLFFSQHDVLQRSEGFSDFLRVVSCFVNITSVFPLVSKGVVLSSLLDLVFGPFLVVVLQKDFLNVACLHLQAEQKLGQNIPKGTLSNEELLVTVVLHFQTHRLVHRSHSSVDLLIKRFTIDIRTNRYMRVPGPSLKGLFIQIASQVDPFVSSYIVLQSIEVFCSVCCRRQEDDPVVSTVSEGHPAPPFFVHDGLKLFFGHIGSRVHCTSIAQHNRRLLAHFCQTGKVIFCIHLEANQQTLELDSLLDVEFRHKDHASCFHHESRYFRHHEDSESFLGEVVMNFFERGAFPSAWSSCDGYFIDGVFSVVSEGKVFDVFFEVDLIEGILELLDT